MKKTKRAKQAKLADALEFKIGCKRPKIISFRHQHGDISTGKYRRFVGKRTIESLRKCRKWAQELEQAMKQEFGDSFIIGEKD